MAPTFFKCRRRNRSWRSKENKNANVDRLGKKDKKTPLEDAYEINRTIDGSRLEIIPGAGHKLHRSHPQELKISFFNS